MSRTRAGHVFTWKIKKGGDEEKHRRKRRGGEEKRREKKKRREGKERRETYLAIAVLCHCSLAIIVLCHCCHQALTALTCYMDISVLCRCSLVAPSTFTTASGSFLFFLSFCFVFSLPLYWLVFVGVDAILVILIWVFFFFPLKSFGF